MKTRKPGLDKDEDMIEERYKLYAVSQKDDSKWRKQSVVSVNSYDEAAVYEAVDRHFTVLGVEEDLYEEIRVLVKPNLIAPKKPDLAATTHPAIVKAVVNWLYEHGVRNITVADSPGGVYTPEFLKSIYHTCGLNSLSEKATLNMDVTFDSVVSPEGFANHTFNIIQPIIEADYVINLPKLKTHGMTGMSAGIKNMFGSVPGLQKPQLHYRWKSLEEFSRMLVELACVTAPDITLIDGIFGMEGDGPTGGTPVKAGVTLASRDVFTQDYYAALVMHINPKEVEMLHQARKMGLLHVEETVFAGDVLPLNLPPFEAPQTKNLDFTSHMPGIVRKPFAAVAAKLLKSYPVLEKEKCVGCLKCQQVCPPRIIQVKDGKPVFQKKNCISCFCCQEMCPMNAIKVKKAL